MSWELHGDDKKSNYICLRLTIKEITQKKLGVLRSAF